LREGNSTRSKCLLIIVGIKDEENHSGLVSAVQRHFQGSSWQSWQPISSRLLLDKSPKAVRSAREDELRQIYEATDIDSARASKQRILEKYEAKAIKWSSLKKPLMISWRCLACLSGLGNV
jgi:hypothetical protein